MNKELKILLLPKKVEWNKVIKIKGIIKNRSK